MLVLCDYYWKKLVKLSNPVVNILASKGTAIGRTATGKSKRRWQTKAIPKPSDTLLSLRIEISFEIKLLYSQIP